MNRNVTILIIVLIILLMVGFLLWWWRGKFQTKPGETTANPTPTVIKVETVTPTTSQVIASPSAAATSAAKTATRAGSKVK